MGVEIENVTKQFTVGRSEIVTAVDDVSIDVQENGFLTILGPSGCGKTTLLRMIAGFESPTSGRIVCNGVEVTGPGSDRVVVFQRPWLYPWQSVWENVAFGLKLASRKIDRHAVDEVIGIVGLDGFEKRAPHELSGGMQQRAALARALVLKPKVLLMDEPFGALDAQTRLAMQEFLLSIWDQIKATVVFITHDIEEAILLGDRLVVMSARPGRVALDESIDLPRPRNEATAMERRFIEMRRSVLDILMSSRAQAGGASARG